MKTLKAKQGYYYTQSGDISIQDRVITDCLYMPDSADESAWAQITEAQKAEYDKQLETYNASMTSTEADYIAYLRQPATISSADYKKGILTINIGD
jgi:hypothetical protein